MRVLFTCVLLLTLIAPSLWAQRVTGVLVSAEGGAPVHGAIIVLEDEQGGTRAGALSDAQGRFTLTAPAAGRYRLKAERIGFETSFSPYLQVAPEPTVEQRLVLSPQAVALQGITVRGGRRCHARPEAGLETHQLWEEARKALSAVALTESLRFVSFRIRSFDREIDGTGRVSHERSSARLVMNDYPFRSAPAVELMERGFVHQVGDSIIYHGPDAHVLLSDEFLDAHCFSVGRDRNRAALVGLSFEPIPQRRHLPGAVTGVLWIHERSAELRQLEYRYSRLQGVTEIERFGGRLNFERLENGAWIVRDWVIQTPSFHVARERSTQVGLSVRETGGEVEAITQVDETQRLARRSGAISGRVLDAEKRTPVAGAVVYLSGTQHEATTGADGRFHFSDVREGRYLLSAYHPEHEIAGELLPTREISVTAGEEIQVELLLPGLAALGADHLTGMPRLLDELEPVRPGILEIDRVCHHHGAPSPVSACHTRR